MPSLTRNRTSRKPRETLGMDDSNMDGRGDDVLKATRPVDDLDEPMDGPKARSVTSNFQHLIRLMQLQTRD